MQKRITKEARELEKLEKAHAKVRPQVLPLPLSCPAEMLLPKGLDSLYNLIWHPAEESYLLKKYHQAEYLESWT